MGKEDILLRCLEFISNQITRSRACSIAFSENIDNYIKARFPPRPYPTHSGSLRVIMRYSNQNAVATTKEVMIEGLMY